MWLCGRLPMVTVNVKAGFVERAASRCPPLILRLLRTSTNGSSTGTSGIAAMVPPPTRRQLFLHQTLAGSNSQQRNIGRRAAGVGLVLLPGRRFFERVAIDRKIGSTGSRQGEGGLNVNLQDRYVDGGLLPSRMLCDVDAAPDVPAHFPAS